jgi:hypothetical protein
VTRTGSLRFSPRAAHSDWSTDSVTSSSSRPTCSRSWGTGAANRTCHRCEDQPSGVGSIGGMTIWLLADDPPFSGERRWTPFEGTAAAMSRGRARGVVATVDDPTDRRRRSSAATAGQARSREFLSNFHRRFNMNAATAPKRKAVHWTASAVGDWKRRHSSLVRNTVAP